jgi:hypothetical protein
VIIERMLFQVPDNTTIATCTMTKMTNADAVMKWMVRADWRPPKISTRGRKSGVDAR